MAMLARSVGPGHRRLTGVNAVQGVHDLDRLGAQGPVDGLVVGVGQLAGAQVELGVADLVVLGVAGRLELGELGRLLV